MKLTYYEKVLKLEPSFVAVEKNSFPILKSKIGTKILGFKDLYDPLVNSLDDDQMLLSLFLSMKSMPSQFITLMNIIYQLYYFWVYQKTVYKISDEVADSLLYTDIDNMYTDNLLIPTPNFYLSFSNKYFKMRDPITGLHQVSGIFVTSEEDSVYKYFRILVTADANEASEDPLDDSVFFYRFKLKKGSKIKEGIELDGDVDEKIIKDWETYYKDQAFSTFNFICNIILYLNYSCQTKKYTKNKVPPCEAKNPKKIRKWEKKYKDVSKLHFYDISNEKLKDILKNDISNDANITDRIRWKNSWLVRGHWHRYWVGKGREELRVNWLQPYWKGEERLEINA